MFKVAMFNSLGGDVLQENTFFFTFDPDIWDKVIYNIVQELQHYVRYIPAKFKRATSNGLGGDAFAKKYIIRPLTLSLA